VAASRCGIRTRGSRVPTTRRSPLCRSSATGGSHVLLRTLGLCIPSARLAALAPAAAMGFTDTEEESVGRLLTENAVVVEAASSLAGRFDDRHEAAAGRAEEGDDSAVEDAEAANEEEERERERCGGEREASNAPKQVRAAAIGSPERGGSNSIMEERSRSQSSKTRSPSSSSTKQQVPAAPFSTNEVSFIVTLVESCVGMLCVSESECVVCFAVRSSRESLESLSGSLYITTTSGVCCYYSLAISYYSSSTVVLVTLCTAVHLLRTKSKAPAPTGWPQVLLFFVVALGHIFEIITHPLSPGELALLAGSRTGITADGGPPIRWHHLKLPQLALA
jgi:hypothetical protein